MDFTVPEETRQIADALLEFVDKVVLPLDTANAEILENDRNLYQPDGTYVPEVRELRQQVRMASAEAGFYTMFGPKSLGGGGLDHSSMVYIQEQLNRHVGPDRTLIRDVVIASPFTNGLSPLLEHLRPEVRERYLDDIRGGAKNMCFGLSEPDAGSDVYNIRTRAVRDGDRWVLNGTKQWITNAAYADYALIFAVTDPERFAARKGGLTGFFVDTKQAGFSVDSVIPLMGRPGSDVGIISLTDVAVPADHVLGEVHEGMSLAIAGVSRGRLNMAGVCVGLAQWALDKSLAYAAQRRTFGRAIAEHGAIQAHLAEMAMDLYAAKNMVRHCAWQVDRDGSARKEVSMVKAFSTEMLFRVMDRAIQVHGAMGLTNEVRLEAGLRFARIRRIPDGTGEIQRRTVAKELLAGNREI